MFEYSIGRLLRALQRAGETERPPVSGNRSKSWGISTWIMAIGAVAGVFGFFVDQRLMPVGVTLFMAGLIAAFVGAVIDALKNR